jgi:hypothetical protein
MSYGCVEGTEPYFFYPAYPTPSHFSIGCRAK